MIDNALEYVCSRISTGKRVSFEEIKETLEDRGLKGDGLEVTLGFLRKYFFEVDESRQVKLPMNFCTVYQKLASATE